MALVLLIRIRAARVTIAARNTAESDRAATTRQRDNTRTDEEAISIMTLRHSPWTLLVLFGLFAGAMIIPPPAIAQTTFEPPPEEWSEFNPCTNETVLVKARTRFVLYPRLDASGGVHLTAHIFQNGKGQTVAGDPATYQFAHENVHETYARDFFTPVQMTLIVNHLLIRQGNDGVIVSGTKEDFVLRARMHITFNSNGIITADFTRLDTSCPM